MRKKIFGLIINIVFIFSCVFPLMACSRKITRSDRQMYVLACKSVNNYAASNGGVNHIAQAFSSTNPLSCNMSDIDSSSAIKNSLIVTDVRSESRTGPFTVTVTFKAPIRGKTNTNALLSVMLAFKIKDSGVNAALAEYIYCTTHSSASDIQCKDYTNTDKAAYTTSKVAEIVKTGKYIKTNASSVHGSVSSPGAKPSFSFNETNIELLNGETIINSQKIKVTNGVVNVVVEVSLDDLYVGPASALNDFCEEALGTLYSSISQGTYSYAYLNDAVARFFHLGYEDLRDISVLTKTEVKYEVDSDWIEVNAESENTYKTVTLQQPEGTITFTRGNCKYTLRVYNTNGSFVIPSNDYLMFGKVEKSDGSDPEWYILDESCLNEDGSFDVGKANRIETSNEYRCPDGDKCLQEFH
ncbi:MAG: hypothetical protein E7184_00015 [Erysipelotrichaceae bacterium]|nr:hypothetical protein [Erysipelotrichaceae bacterium]